MFVTLKPSGGDSLQELNIAFKLRVLGTFELSFEASGELIPVTTAKMRALLAYLATIPSGTESRRQLAGLLWASRSDEQARQNMRQMLSNFRRNPCAQLLCTTDLDRVGFDLSLISIDRTALVDIPADADADMLGLIADLYRGDFGAGLEIGEPDFDTWLHAERLRCREAAIALFNRLIRTLAELGRHDEALRRANRLLDLDPLREETHRLVLTQEAIISGRATAMQRYESFRVLLRDELGVRPEPATLRLLDELRRHDAKTTTAVPSSLDAEPELTDPPPVTPPPQTGRTQRRWTRSGIAAAFAILLLLGAVAFLSLQLRPEKQISYIDENSGRASIVILPFESDAASRDLKARAHAFEVEARLAFARQYRMTVIDLSDAPIVQDAAATGRALRARYVVRTRLTETVDGVNADVSLLDSASGISLATAPMPMTDPPFKFARQMFRYIFPEIAMNRAKTLSEVDPDSIAALSWRGAAAQVRTRVGSIDLDAFDLFDRVLARDPNNFEALMSLVGGLQLRISRGQSVDRTADLDRSEALLMKAREQKPSLAEVAFLEGMNKMLRSHFAEAAPDFDRALQLDHAHWIAALKAAHVKMFLGRLEDADREMETVMPNLLPDIGAPESAYIAGEIALTADHVDRAVSYLDTAVRGNPTVARIQALYGAALWMAGRATEAHAAALLSQTLNPPFPPEQLALRGGAGASPRYRNAKDRQVAALRSALAATTTDVSEVSRTSQH